MPFEMKLIKWTRRLLKLCLQIVILNTAFNSIQVKKHKICKK